MRTLNWGGVTLDPIICSSSQCSDLNFISFLFYFLFVRFVLISQLCSLTLLELIMQNSQAPTCLCTHHHTQSFSASHFCLTGP